MAYHLTTVSWLVSVIIVSIGLRDNIFNVFVCNFNIIDLTELCLVSQYVYVHFFSNL